MYTSKTKSYTVTKKDIRALPFEDLAQSCTTAGADPQALASTFAETYGVKYHNWVYPQILAHIGKWTPQRDVLGIYQPRETLKHNCQGNPFNLGVYYFCMSNQRYVPKQASIEGRDYCGLVPLVLAAFKKYQDIPYSSWDRSRLDSIVNPSLYEAICDEVPDYTLEEILEFRTIGLTIKSGSRAGTQQNPATTYGIKGVPVHIERGDEIIPGPGKLHQLSRMIVCQTWCAHPQWRNRYMILNHKNLDHIPDPLVSDNWQEVPKTVKPEPQKSNLPWL